MKKQILSLFIILLFKLNGYSQACGGGILTFSIYTLNGNKIEDISYEIFPVSNELIEKYSLVNNYEDGKIINSVPDNELRQNENFNNKLNEILEKSSITKSGKILHSLKFKTLELRYYPIILKISIKGKTVYIFGNYFGGCDRETFLIWNGNYFKLV